MRMQQFKVHRAVLTLLISMVVLPIGVGAATLHAIIVADTNDADIGAQKDEEDIKKLVENIGQNTCLQPAITTIDGAAVAPGGGGYDKVKSAIENLSVTTNDVVLFYYSGHGANAETGSRWPGLGVEGQTTPRSRWIELAWVRDTLKAKNPRLFIAMADACNVFLSGGGGRGHQRGAQPSAYEQLFLGYSGSIVASGSIPEQYSFGGADTGGLFTQQFLKSLYQGLNSATPDWNNIMNQAIQAIPVRHPQQSVQQPQKDVQVIKSRGLPQSACAASDNTLYSSPLHSDGTPSPSPKGTCADNVYEHKNGQRCCVDKGGKEHCYND